jgi:hypothetical protein
MVVDGATVMMCWMTASRDTVKAEGIPLTKGNYPTYLRAGGKFPAGSVLGPYRSATRRWFGGDKGERLLGGAAADTATRRSQEWNEWELLRW